MDASLYKCDVVIVEDVLSCIRVGEYLPTGSLLGTSVGHAGALENILTHSGVLKPRVGVWLDPDRAGVTGTAKLQRTLSLMGLEHTLLTSRKDPKNLTDYEIRSTLLK